MEPARLRDAMDDMVRFAIRLQEQAGMDVVGDGEWRRSQYVDEYLDRIGGFEPAWRYEHAGEVTIVGKGAGGVETAGAVLRDLIDIRREIAGSMLQ